MVTNLLSNMHGTIIQSYVTVLESVELITDCLSHSLLINSSTVGIYFFYIDFNHKNISLMHTAFGFVFSPDHFKIIDILMIPRLIKSRPHYCYKHETQITSKLQIKYSQLHTFSQSRYTPLWRKINTYNQLSV